MDKSPNLEIILIEDDMSDAELTIRALKKNKLINKVVLLKDGEEAIDYLFVRGGYTAELPDNNSRLILLDLKLPGMSGLEVLKRIKQDDRTKHILVVILTSSKENPDIEECYRLGANSYIVKPVEFENFSNAVTQIGLYWLLLNHPPVSPS
ncbi:MAG: response regulator [Ferruginibacter sp.]